MKNTLELPEGYEKIMTLDLQKDKKETLKITSISALIAVIMLIIGIFHMPITSLFEFDEGMVVYLIRWSILAFGLIAYIVLHEAVHGICMKHYVHTKIHYGMTLMYAYAGCDAYFNKKSYIIIALAPIVVWGIVLLIVCLMIPSTWFWSFYFIQICNLSGAAGDLYVTYRFMHMPDDILIQDTGVSMSVYGKSKE